MQPISAGAGGPAGTPIFIHPASPAGATTAVALLGCEVSEYVAGTGSLQGPSADLD